MDSQCRTTCCYIENARSVGGRIIDRVARCNCITSWAAAAERIQRLVLTGCAHVRAVMLLSTIACLNTEKFRRVLCYARRRKQTGGSTRQGLQHSRGGTHCRTKFVTYPKSFLMTAAATEVMHGRKQ